MGLGTKRNQPCFCGSGKKYKKCHLAQAGTYGTFKIDEMGRMIMSPGNLSVEVKKGDDNDKENKEVLSK